MKVFVLFTEQVIDCEDSHTVQVFASKENAMKQFEEFVRKEKKNAEEDEWETDFDETSFAAYEEGRWCENRVFAEISELEIV